MTEAAPEAVAPENPAADPAAENKPDGSEVASTDATDWKAEARKWEQRAKENKAAAAELEKQRKASMTEAEKAVAEAEERGRTAATQAFGQRLAKSEIRAVATEAGAELAGVFDYLDLNRFVGEDGEPDSKAIKSFVDALPKKDAQPPSFDGGGRATAAAAPGMSQLIRKAAGRA